MNINEKPVLAATSARANEKLHSHDTPVLDNFQCPCCKLSGSADLFELGWPEQLHELIARNPGLGISGRMSFQDARFLCNWLIRRGAC